MKTKITSILLTLAMLVCACAGCADKDGGGNSGTATEKPYDYDLSKYVTVGNYKGLTATSSEFVFTDEDLQSQIAMILSDNAETVEVTDRAVQNGDTVNIDYTGYMDGEAFENGSDTGFDLVIGSGSFIEGFESGLIGAEKGETRTVDATFSDPYSNNPDFAGKTAQFEVTVNSITASVTPEYNEDFIATYYPEYNTMAEFEAAVKLSAEENFNYENEMNIIDQVWSQIMENSTTLQYPEKEYQATFDAEVDYYEGIAQSYYGTTLEDYLATYEGKTIDEFKAELDIELKAYLDEQLVLYYIIRAEKLDLTDEDYQAGLAQYAIDFGATEDQLVESYGEERLRYSIQWEKVLKFVVDNATVTPETAAG